MAEGLGANFFLTSGTWKRKCGHRSAGLSLDFPPPHSSGKKIPSLSLRVGTANLKGLQLTRGSCVSGHWPDGAHGPSFLPEASFGLSQEAEWPHLPSSSSLHERRGLDSLSLGLSGQG